MLSKKLWIIMFIINISLISFVFLYKYNHYLVYFGVCVQEERSYLKVLIKEDDLNKISNKLLINKSNYECIINKMSTDYVMDNNYIKYYEVFYDCPALKLEDNEVLNIKIDLGKKTIYETLKEKVKKGLN